MRESDLFNHKYDYRLNWTPLIPVTNNIYYLLIITLTKLKFVIYKALF